MLQPIGVSHAKRDSIVLTMHVDIPMLVQLVLFRPFVAAAMPTVMLLNGLAVDSTTRDTGNRVIAPLMHQYWASGDGSICAEDSHVQGGVDFADYRSEATSLSNQQQHAAGWGLKSVQRMSQLTNGTSREALGTASSGQGDADATEEKEEIAPEERRAIEQRVEAAVARAIEVER